MDVYHSMFAYTVIHLLPVLLEVFAGEIPVPTFPPIA
jgi:hypothetical protein